MSDIKSYYYLKLKEDFFSRPEIKIIKGIDNGHRYICILTEMYLRSLKREGMLVLDDGIPYDVEMLASVIGEDCAHVEKAIEIFQKYRLIDILDDGAIFMMHIQSYIGQSTNEADRVRDYRRKIAEKKVSVQTYDKRTPELKIEIKKEIELKKETIVLPHGDKFSAHWEEWLTYRKERKLKTAPTTIKAQLKKLSEVDEDTACQMICQSIENGWQGLFEKRNSFGSNRPQKPTLNDTYNEALKLLGH